QRSVAPGDTFRMLGDETWGTDLEVQQRQGQLLFDSHYKPSFLRDLGAGRSIRFAASARDRRRAPKISPTSPSSSDTCTWSRASSVTGRSSVSTRHPSECVRIAYR